MKKTLTLALTLLTLTIRAQTVNLAWDTSPETNIVVGYNLYLNTTNYLLGKTNGLSLRIPVSIFPLNYSHSIFATAYDTNNIESEPSNAVFVHRPSEPFSLSSSKQGNIAFNINWAIHPNTNVNAYNIYLGTNINNLNKIGVSLGRLNNSYTIYNSNFVYGVSNFVTISAFNTVLNPTNSVIESPVSTNLHINLPPRPPKNLRVNVIVQSSTNLIAWNNVTNYEYFAESLIDFEVFRAKMEISKN